MKILVPCHDDYWKEVEISEEELQKIIKQSTIQKETGRRYTPTCPRGYEDCVNDPAYIYDTHPEWYKEIYGDLTPEQASEKSCKLKVKDDPDEKFYCYDDEDK